MQQLNTLLFSTMRMVLVVSDGLKHHSSGTSRLPSRAMQQLNTILLSAMRMVSVISEVLKKHFQWYEKAARQGYAAAQFKVGQYYEFGIGRKQSLTKSFQWYKKAAEQGDKDARCLLQERYLCGAKS